MADWAAPDELHMIRTMFYVGNWEKLQEEYAVAEPEPANEIEKECLLLRSLMAQGKLQQAIDQVPADAAMALRVVQLHAGLRAGKQQGASGSSAAGGDGAKALAQLEAWTLDEATRGSRLFRVTAAALLVDLGEFSKALELVGKPSNMEEAYTAVQVLLQMRRADLAAKHVAQMRLMDDDNPLCLLASAALAALKGGDSAREASEFIQELIDRFGGSILLHNALAAAHMAQGEYANAFSTLRESVAIGKQLQLSPDPETLINQIVALEHLGKATSAAPMRQSLEELYPEHPWLAAEAAAAADFDLAAKAMR